MFKFWVIRDVNLSFIQLQRRVVQTLPGASGQWKNQGRLFISDRFTIQGKKVMLVKGKASPRYYVKVYIRGASRPYTINVEAFKEKLGPTGFRLVGKSRWVAEGVTRAIRQNLNLGPGTEECH